MRTIAAVFLVLAFFALAGTGESADKKQQKKGAPVTGKVFEVDTEKGFVRRIIVRNTKKEKGQTDASFKVSDDTKVVVGGKEYVGKDGLKEIKPDDTATVTQDSDYKVLEVRVTAGARKK